MKNKKILICLHEITTAIQIITYLEQYKFKSNQFELCILLNSDNITHTFKSDIKYLFRNYKVKILEFHFKEFKMFTLYNFFEWYKIFLLNRFYKKKIELFLKKNSIKISSFSEILYTNDRLSNYLTYNFKKKLYFFHGVGDFKIFTKLNLLRRYKNIFFYYLNRYINKVEIPNINDNFTSIYIDELKFKNLNLNKLKLNNEIFKIKFTEYYKFKKNFFNKNLNKKYILFLLKFPRYNSRAKKFLKKKFINTYFTFLLTNIISTIKKNIKYRDISLLIKTKNNLNTWEKQILQSVIKKNFKNDLINLYFNSKKNFINAEYLAFNKNCHLLISNFSTADFIIKKLRPKMEIWSYMYLIHNFYKNNFTYYQKGFMQKKLTYNLSSIIKDKNFYKNIK